MLKRDVDRYKIYVRCKTRGDALFVFDYGISSLDSGKFEVPPLERVGVFTNKLRTSSIIPSGKILRGNV